MHGNFLEDPMMAKPKGTKGSHHILYIVISASATCNSFFISTMAPIASRMLSKTDIEKRLTLPSKSLTYFPPLSRDKHMVDFRARDEDGRVWKFRIYTRKANKYRKPILTKGWREFVCSKHLGIGDKVAFYMEKEDAGSVNYRVKVERAVKLFGVGFGA
ncbi:hypothetical protein V6N13_069502 [Hibiscus sabdariffa]|uniref:TF-B3 domain-containing protein n=1 Tax=Hibiscus sabdariffa TaxID=183260 RepID=A0ABR2PGF0_9ROSI